MNIIVNPNKQLVNEMLRRLELNGGYCPCSLVRVPDMKCMCREFREMNEGTCHCGLYIKRKESENNERAE